MRAGRFHKGVVKGVCAGWLVTIGASVCVLTTSADPALGYTLEPPSKALICLNDKTAVEAAVSSLPLEPANGATVTVGTPVVFSGEAVLHNAPTFSVASSPALLSSPDIDGGTGSPSGALYTYTSTKATAAPRTIYWTASFTFTPEDCESSSTFTTPVRTLIVALSEAETKQHEEEAKKKQEEEAAAAGSVVLDGVTINVENGREAAVKLTCSDSATCVGTLTLTAKTTAGKGKTKHAEVENIGTASFSIAAGGEATVKVTLDKTGRTLLSAAHGHLSAALTIVRTSPPPNKTQTQQVRLEQQKKTAKAKGGK